MKPRYLLPLLVAGAVSMQARALPPVVNDSGYPAPAPAPNMANAQRPPSTNTIYEMMSRLEQLQTEVQQLTGKVEEQAYLNAELKKRLSTLYSDFDERLQNVESKLDGNKPQDAENTQDQPGAETGQPGEDNAAEKEPAAEPAAQPSDSAGQQNEEAAAAPKQPEAEPVPEGEKQEYQQAYDALRNGRTVQSIEAFNAFLSKYPSGQLAGNAQYWLGEAYRVNQDADSARKAFNKVIESYPNSTKVPDALLKLGYIELDLKNWAKAREYLTHVNADFPNTTAARLASKKLLLIEDAKP
jgi:tol-pal system protein YbgF